MRAVFLVLIAFVAVGLGFAGWRYSQGDFVFVSPLPVLGPPKPPVPHAATAEEIDAARSQVAAKLQSVPEFSGFFKKLQATFPADYAQALDDFARRMANEGGKPAVDVYLSETYRALRQTRGIMAAKAGPEALGRVFDTQATVLAALGRVDPHLCVDFLYGGATQSYFDFSTTHRPLVAAMAEAGLDAIIDGHARNIERPHPSDKDFDELEQALSAKGLGKPEIDALVDGKIPDPPIDDARMCRAGQVELEVFRTLPEDLRMRIYGLTVELMARS